MRELVPQSKGPFRLANKCSYQNIFLFFNKKITCKALIICLALITLQSAPPNLCAANLEDGFKPVSGYLVQTGTAGVIIDCGQRKGVSIGDLFAVLERGKPLIHPVTGQTLGTREKVKIVLKVIRVEADYSICHPLKRYFGVIPTPGSPVKRFAVMPALFIDLNGTGIELFSRLRDALPQLSWADYKTGLKLQQTLQNGGPARLGYDFYVVNQGLNLTLYNGDNGLIRTIDTRQFSSPEGTAHNPEQKRLREKSNGRYRFSTTDSDNLLLTQYRQIAKLNLVVKSLSTGDLDNDGQPEIVFTDGENIYIYQISDHGLKYKYRYHFNKWGSIINVVVGDISGDHRAEIMVNVFKESEDGFSSFVISENLGKYRIQQDNIPFIMSLLGGRSVADKGVYFVGQGFAEKEFYDHQVAQLELKNNKVSSRGKFSVPAGFTLPGALYCDINNDRIKELCFINRQNFLEIYQGRRRLWISSERLAGSLQSVQYEVGTPRVSYTEKRSINPSLISYVVNSNGAKELLLIDNESDMSTAVGEYGRLNKSHIKTLRSNGKDFTLQKMTGQLSGSIQGLQIVNGELLCAMVKRGDDLMKLTGSTCLLAFPLGMTGDQP